MILPKELLGAVRGGHVLDVATGSGSFISFLLDGLGSYESITGIDVSEKGAADFARTFAGRENIHFIRMDAARMEFPSASFDAVSISNSLHHLADLPAVLLEMMRLLRPGGHFIVSEMFKDGQTEAQMTHVMIHHWFAAVDACHGIPHMRTFSRQEILDILAALDLQEVVMRDLHDLEPDPRDPGTISSLAGVMESNLPRIRGLPQETCLQYKWQELRQRLQVVGSHPATTLFYMGRK